MSSNSLEKHDELVGHDECHTPQEDRNCSFSPRDATKEEIRDLPHVTDQIPFAAWLVILAGAAERATYFGVMAPWQNYMQNPRRGSSLPGALGLGQSIATIIYNAFFISSFLNPILFALLSDLWLGRYLTLMLGLGCYLIGCLLLLTTSIPVALEHGAGLGGLIGAMVFISLGAGCVKAIYLPLLGDQYFQKKAQLKQLKDGKLVIVDGTRTLQLLYNIYYWFCNLAALSIIATTFLEKEVDFWAAYLFCTASLFISFVLLFVYSSKIRKIAPKGDALRKAGQIIACSIRDGFKLDNAKPSNQLTRHGKQVSWDDQTVDELKQGLVACKVITSYILFYLIINEMFNNLVSQAGQMELGGVPNDMIQAFSAVACVILGPVIQWFYSMLAKHKIQFGPIARITVAFFFCGASMAYATGIQRLIYNTGPCYDHPLACPASNNGKIPNAVTVWVQLPLYFIIAIAEILGFVTAGEYAYGKAPANMKSIIQAFIQLTACVASVIGLALGPVSKDPYLLTMYACLAGITGLATVGFWCVFHKYDAADVEADRGITQDSTADESGASP